MFLLKDWFFKTKIICFGKIANNATRDDFTKYKVRK